jgi:hypothetical protein
VPPRPPPRQRDERRPREQEHEHRVAGAGQQQRRPQVGDQQVLGHVRRQQVVPVRVDGGHQPDHPQRDPRVPEQLLAQRHRHAAPPQDPQRPQVQVLGDRDRREDARV